MRKLLIFFSIIASFPAFSQINDTIKPILPAKTTLFFRFDNRYSYVSDSISKVTGFKFGVDYNQRVRIGAGNHRLVSPFTKKIYIDSVGVKIDSVNAVLRMSYIGFFYEYVFMKTKKWEFSIPVQIGYGTSSYDYIYNERVFKMQKNPVLVFETNIEGHYKMLRYLGIGGGTGIRLMLVKNKEIEENFNSPIYILKIKLFLGELYKDIFKKKIEKLKDLEI